MLEKISLNALRAFYVVCKTGSLSGAAHEMGITLSAVSRHISAVESKLNTLLISRVSKKVLMTEKGKILYEHLEVAFCSIEQGLAKVGDSANTTPVLLIAPTSFLARIVMPNLGVIEQIAQGRKLKIVESNTAEVNYDAAIKVYFGDYSDFLKSRFIHLNDVYLKPYCTKKYLEIVLKTKSARIINYQGSDLTFSNGDIVSKIKDCLQLADVSSIFVETKDVAFSAASSHQGIVLANECSAISEIGSGRFVQLDGLDPCLAGAYWMLKTEYGDETVEKNIHDEIMKIHMNEMEIYYQKVKSFSK